MADEDRTTAFGLWRYANEYLRAARILRGADSDPVVAYQCVCHAIELGFKSYLRAHGFSLDDLIRLGHPLTRCMAAATKHGLSNLPADHVGAIRQIDQYYAAHEFRYIVTGYKQFPPLETLLAAGAMLLDFAVDAVAATKGGPELSARMRSKISRHAP